MFEGKAVYGSNDETTNRAIREILARKTGAAVRVFPSSTPGDYPWLTVDHHNDINGYGSLSSRTEVTLEELCEMPDYALPKEMTMEEINKALGYTVKVIE